MTCLGLSKFGVGHDRHRPVLFLILLVLGAGVAGLVTFGRRLRCSLRGQRALATLRHDHADLELRAARANAGMTVLEVPMAAALFGVGALSSGLFDDLNETLKSPSLCGAAGCGGGDAGRRLRRMRGLEYTSLVAREW